MNPDRSNRRLLIVALGGMELSWRYAWLNLLGLLLLPGVFPWPHAVAAFGGAFLITGLTSGRGFRIITCLIIHLVGFALLDGLLIHHLHGGEGFLGLGWPGPLAEDPEPWKFWASLALETGLAAWLWLGGFFLARKPLSYDRVNGRFDIGLTAFFLLFFLVLLLTDEFKLTIGHVVSRSMMVSFFCFGLLSLSLARIRGPVARDMDSGYRGLGSLFTFLAVALSLAGGAVAFFMPFLTTAAETGVGALKTVARPLIPYIEAVLRFLFARRWGRTTGGGAETDAPAHLADGRLEQPGSWLVELSYAIAWIMLGLIALLLLALTAYFIHRLYLRLMSRTAAVPLALRPVESLWVWLRRRIARLIRWAARIRSGRIDPMEVYLCLLKWGRRSGLPRRVGETPREYGRRLVVAFPRASLEITAIVDSLELAVFAVRPPSPSDLGSLRRSRRQLARPGLWLQRLKAWLPGSGG